MLNHSTLMKLFLLTVLVLIATASIQGTHLRTTNKTSNDLNRTYDDPKYLELPIYRDDYGLYYINVTWKNDTSFYPEKNSTKPDHKKRSNNTDPALSTGKMLLSLYTNESFLTTCPGFIPYECDLFECQSEELSPSKATYLYQGTEVYGNEVAIGMTSDAFSVGGYALTYADSCAPGFPLNISGFLGLGYSLNALFEVSRNFSIFLSDGADGFNSALYAGSADNDERIDHNENYVFSGPVDENWMIKVNSIQVSVGEQFFPFNVTLPPNFKVLFDLNTDVIGLPIDVYNNVLDILYYYGLHCDQSLYRPNCTFVTDIYSLPTLNLIVDKPAGEMLEIRPAAYIQRFQLGDSFTYSLLLGAITQDQPSNLVVSSKYSNRIILGRPFLTFYYVHFSVCESYQHTSVTVRCANHKEPDTPIAWAKIMMIIGAFILTIGLITLCVFICIKKRKEKPEIQPWDPLKGEPSLMEAFRQNASVLSNSPKYYNDSILSQPIYRGTTIEKKPPETNASSNINGRTGRVWSSERIRFSSSSDIQAHTYGKQRYKGLDDHGFTVDD